MRKIYYGTKHAVINNEGFDPSNNPLKAAILEGVRNIDIHDHYLFSPVKLG